MGRFLYFADDKDIRDLLESSKKRLTPEVLREFLLSRGVIVSPDTPKTDLFERISMWTLDWDELKWLLDKTASADRSERFTSAVVPGSFDASEVRSILDTLQKGGSFGQIESFVPTQSHAGTVSVAVTYTEMDPAKTRLRQKRVRDGSLTFDITPTGVALRHEANDKMQGIAEEVVKALSTAKGEDTKPRRIELNHLPDPETRTRFFLTLLESVPGLTTQDVSKVSVQRAQGSAAERADTEDEDSDQIEMLEHQVRGAMLRGGSLITSPEFQMLKRDFYLCGLEWTAQESGEKGRIVRFEAAFDDPETCTGFRYKVKGIIDRKKSGDGVEFVQTPRSCTEIENSAFVAQLETASHTALDTIEAESAIAVKPPPETESAPEGDSDG